MAKKLRITAAADADIESIGNFTFNSWGLEKEYYYLEKIYAALDIISNLPEIGKARDDVKKGYRAYDIGEYLIFYRILSEHIDILGITDVHRDFKRLYEYR